MTNDLVKDALHRIADRAGPVDGLAERALRGATRRRAAATAAIAAGTVAAIATPVALLAQTGGDGSHRTQWAGPAAAPSPSPQAGALPTNTTAERAVARACVTGNPAFADIMGNGKISHPPTSGPGYQASDFRVLVSHPVQNGRIVFLGSEKGHRTCVLDRSGKPSALDRVAHQTANFWQFEPGDGFGHLTKPASLQDEGGGAIAYGAAPYELHVGGLVTPQVARVTLRFGAGKPVTATISHGFFLGGVVVPNKQGTKLIDQSVDVTAYDAAGKVIFSKHQPGVPAGTPG
jgi:hypothetical protein